MTCLAVGALLRNQSNTHLPVPLVKCVGGILGWKAPRVMVAAAFGRPGAPLLSHLLLACLFLAVICP